MYLSLVPEIFYQHNEIPAYQENEMRFAHDASRETLTGGRHILNATQLCVCVADIGFAADSFNNMGVSAAPKRNANFGGVVCTQVV